MNRILWADDEISLLKPYIIYLQEKGYEVTPVNNGQDAIDACQEQHFDIVFLDENMPGLSGLEALQEIKAMHPTLPVVMITKSEEEQIMEQAIGQKIADYLIKPVNPSQILLCLKKHIHQREIVEEHTNSTYRQEFSDITYMIDTANTIEEWMAIERTLTRWELELENVDSAMHDMLRMQREQANKAFAKFIAKNYESWWTNPSTRPTMSQDVMKKHIFPLLDKGEKVFFVVIDNFRYDQWKVIQPLLSEWFTVKEEQMYTSILPTATQYARNAIFSGLSPLQIQEMYPDLWIDEDEEESKNNNEEALIQTQLDRFRKRYGYTYYKVNESDFCEKITRQFKGLQTPLNVVILNFITTPMPTLNLLAFLLGALFLIGGMALYSLGSDTSMHAIGSQIGRLLTKKKKLPTILIVAFIIGFIVTIAEPDLMVLAGQVGEAIPPTVLLVTIATGVGIFLLLSFLRIFLTIFASFCRCYAKK